MDDRERTIREISEHLARALLAAAEYSDRQHHVPAPVPTPAPAPIPAPEPVARSRGELMTADEVAAAFKVPVNTIYTWRKTGYGPAAFKVGKYLRWKPEVVEAWIEANA